MNVLGQIGVLTYKSMGVGSYSSAPMDEMKKQLQRFRFEKLDYGTHKQDGKT